MDHTETARRIREGRMKRKKKVIWNTVLFLTVFLLTIYGVFRGQDKTDILRQLKDCSPGWILASFLCVFTFIWSESIIIWYMMRSYGIRLKKRICFLFSSVGFFFSCVTPSASGGQPMQIYFMKKEKIPIPVATVILMIVTITYKLVLVVIGLAIALFARGFMEYYMGNILFLFYLGLALNIVCVTALTILVFHPFFTEKILTEGLKLLEKIHLVKHREGRLSRLENSMDLYNETARFMRSHMGLMVHIFLITVLQRVSLFAVTWFVYRSFGLKETSWMVVITLQAVIAVSVDMLPLPGGMGISETLFLKLFLPVFGSGLLLPGMILSRGLGYYSELLISAVFTLAAVVIFAMRERRDLLNKGKRI